MTYRPLSGLKATQLFAVVLSSVLFGLGSLQAQTSDRITQAIDDSSLVRIPRSTHPLTAGATDLGRLDSNAAMERMVLVLKPSEAQEAKLKKLIDGQHDKASASFHKWLSPAEYGRQFGPSESDLNQIKSWLRQKGFRVDTVANGRQWIEFSGNAGQVEQAFHTEMHHFSVKGEKHVANAQDIAVPIALAPVVSGILSLHNFPKKAGQAKAVHVRRDPASGKLVPDFTLNGGNGTFHFLSPGDYKKIYNTEPLLDAGIDGRGVSIAIVARTDIFLSDVHTFRRIFGLPLNDPVVITNGADPGVNPDFGESSLDVEWSGAIAPRAQIKMVTSASTLTTDGIDLSLSYVIDNAVAPIMSSSYSVCEAFAGTAGNAHITGLYRQAAAEGITAFNSTGDNGSAGCDQFGVLFGPATNGPAVSGLASTPYTVSVGGTQFNENGLEGNYWLANNRPDLSSAIGYIPEQVWNESCDPTIDPNQCQGSGLYFSFASGGGPSNCSTSTLSGDLITCISGTPKPSWQAGIGVPNDGVRDVPDLSLAAAGHDGYLVCQGGFCETTETNGQIVLTDADVVSGTSASTPAMAGMMALLEQKHGKYQGLANYSLYQLAAAERLAGCNSSKITNPQATSSCVFYDVTAGNNGVPGVPGYKAGKGYDMGTGLGSVNAANLVNAWSSAKKLNSATALSVGIRTVQHGQPVPLTVSVKPAVGTGAPSGDFSLVSDKYPPVFGGTLAQSSFTGNVTDLPGGQYNFKAHYAGDAMFASSDSEAVGIRVLPENSTVSAQAFFLPDQGEWVPVTNPLPYGANVRLTIQVQGVSGVGSATGQVEIMDNSTALGLFPLNEKGNAFVDVGQLPQATGMLPGRHVYTVTYHGDNSFQRSMSSGASVTINKGQAIFGMYSATPTVTVGTPVFLTVYGGGSSIVQPTGSVNLTDNGKPLATLPLQQSGIQGAGFAQASETLNFGVGSHKLRLTYSGDANYVSSLRGQTTFDITVKAPTGAASRVTLHQSPIAPTIGESVNYVVTVRPVKPGGPTPTGTVNLLMNIGYSQALNLPNWTPIQLTNGNATFVLPWNSIGRYFFVAEYSGDANYSQADSNTVLTVIHTGTPRLTLTAAPSGLPPDVETELTATIYGAPNNLNLVLPDGPVQFYDSLNGGPERPLGPVQDAIGGTGQFSICVLLTRLSTGTHVIRARYLPAQVGVLLDWGPAYSNAVTVKIP